MSSPSSVRETPALARRRATRPVAAAVACIALLASPRVEALSSMGTAAVSSVEGRPCFALAAGAGSGLRLYGMRVVDTVEEAADGRAVAGEVWGFLIDPPGIALQPGADACVPYGRAPKGAHERAAPRPLARNRIYRIAINAKPLEGGRPSVAYTARFCLKGADDATATLVVILWDDAQGRWRDDAC